jgi:Tol biopolymer transport system component
VKSPLSGTGAGGEPTTVREDASRPQLSPDGKRYAYSAANTTDKGALFVASTDGTGTPVKITGAAGTEVRWSPDGTQIAYLVHDDANNCSHIDAVKADGSEAATPRRIRSCAGKPGFVTELAWVKK